MGQQHGLTTEQEVCLEVEDPVIATTDTDQAMPPVTINNMVTSTDASGMIICMYIYTHIW